MITMKKFRARLKLCNANELARKTGIHPNSIRNYVNGKGKPSYEKVFLLVAAMDGEGEDDS